MAIAHQGGEGLDDLPCVAHSNLADFAVSVSTADEDLADFSCDIAGQRVHNDLSIKVLKKARRDLPLAYATSLVGCPNLVRDCVKTADEAARVDGLVAEILKEHARTVAQGSCLLKVVNCHQQCSLGRCHVADIVSMFLTRQVLRKRSPLLRLDLHGQDSVSNSPRETLTEEAKSFRRIELYSRSLAT